MRARLLVAALAALFAVSIWWLAREHLALDRLVEQERVLRDAIARHPMRLWLLGLAIYTVVSLFPGTSGKSVICGWLYAFWPSLLMVTLSLTLAGLAGFLLSRYLLQDVLRRRFASRLDAIDRRIRQDGAFYMITLRMLHVPFTLVNYTAGTTGLRTRTFAWTTFFGLVPSTMIFVGVGASLPTLATLRDEGLRGAFSPPLIAALVLMGLAPIALRAGIRKLRPSAASAAGDWARDTGDLEKNR